VINEQGGINGRKINFISRDDGYCPPKTVYEHSSSRKTGVGCCWRRADDATGARTMLGPNRTPAGNAWCNIRAAGKSNERTFECEPNATAMIQN
jgi:hypothetical protein